MKNKRKGSTDIILLVILIIIVCAVGGYLVWSNMQKNNNKDSVESVINSEKNNNKTNEISKDSENVNKIYNADDYVKIEEINIHENQIDGTPMFLKKITISNLPLGVYSNFIQKNTQFLSPSMQETNEYDFSNEILYSVIDNVLSICETDEKLLKELNGGFYDYYSLNVDLDSNKYLTNEEMIKKFEVDSKKMYKNILENIANTVTITSFLKDTNGDITADKITVEEFKQKINEYVESIYNRLDLIVIYCYNGMINIKYMQSDILNALGLGTHMGIGIINEPQSITLQK